MEATTTTTSQPSDKGERHHQGALDRNMFCPRLERLICAASELGLRGSGYEPSSGRSSEDPNYPMLRRIGWQAGTHDRFDPARPPSNQLRVLRELEQRGKLLSQTRWRTALAHYLGTVRAHHTLQSTFGHGQGGLAGVVLQRWQAKQAKARVRDGSASAAKLTAALEALRVELLPLELEIAESDFRLFELEERVRPLRAVQAELCAQLAAIAAAGGAIDDEQALVDLCRNGLARAAKDAMVDAAAGEVKLLHRDWYATAKQQAKAWTEEDAPA